MNTKMTIGRAVENDLQVDQSFGRVSNEHATLEIQDGQLIFIDHSSNGSIINGRNIHHSSIAIQNGDEILLANSYKVEWPHILKHFPNLQRRTERFDGSQIESGERKTEMFGNDSALSTPTINETHLEDSNAGQLNEYTQMEVEEYMDKFNFGAFLSTWVWALCNHIFWPLVIIPISLIPYVGQIASLSLCSYLGIKGNRMAWNKSKVPFDKFVSNQRKWIWIGIFLFIAFAFIQFISMYYILSY